MQATRIVRETGKELPLRLLALPLCRNPELVYYYASKRKASAKGSQSQSQDASLSNVASTSGTSPAADNVTERLSGLVTKATSTRRLPMMLG